MRMVLLDDIIIESFLPIDIHQIACTLSGAQTVRQIVFRLLQGTTVDIQSYIVLITHFPHLFDRSEVELLHSRVQFE